MKKIFLIAIVAMMTTVSVNAQEEKEFNRHEVAVSYGAASNSQWLGAFEHIAATMVTFGGAKYENESYTGPFSAEYFYHTNSWLGVGGILVYGQNSQDVYLGSTNKGEYKDSYYTVMPAVKFDWMRKKYFGAYSKFGVGATLRTESYDGKNESAVHFNWQASLLGLEVGSPQIRAFAELGVGEQGILCGGLRYKF